MTLHNHSSDNLEDWLEKKIKQCALCDSSYIPKKIGKWNVPSRSKYCGECKEAFKNNFYRIKKKLQMTT